MRVVDRRRRGDMRASSDGAAADVACGGLGVGSEADALLAAGRV